MPSGLALIPQSYYYEFQQRGVNVLDAGVVGNGTHDDTTAFQNAITNAAGKYPVLVPKNSTVLISAQINLPSNTHLVIDGTILLAPNMPLTSNGGPLNMIATSAESTNIVIEGSGVVDGNYANQTTQKTNLDSGTNGIKSLGSTYVNIRNITIQNVPNTPLLMSSDTNGWGTRHARISNVTIANSGKSSRFEYYGTYDCVISDSEIYGTINDSQFSFYNGAYNCRMVNCSVHDGKFADGVTVYNDTYAAQGVVKDIIISDCHIYNNQANGVSVGSTQSPVVNNENVIIRGCDIHHNNQGNTAGNADVKVYQGYNVTVDGNLLHESGNGTNGTYGIQATSKKLKIINNTIWNEGQGGAVGQGIVVDTDGEISGNTIYDDQATPTTIYGINLQGSSNGKANVHDNSLGATWASGGGAIINATTNGSRVINNQGFNPVQNVTAPAVPASGTAQSNTFPFPVRVYVWGGTVSNISIDGTTLTLTSGEFTLAPGETIAIGYTAVPSWVWIGM